MRAGDGLAARPIAARVRPTKRSSPGLYGEARLLASESPNPSDDEDGNNVGESDARDAEPKVARICTWPS